MRLHAFNTVKHSEKEMLMFMYRFFYSTYCKKKLSYISNLYLRLIKHHFDIDFFRFVINSQLKYLQPITLMHRYYFDLKYIMLKYYVMFCYIIYYLYDVSSS